MNGIIGFLSVNPIVLAIANITAVCTAGYIIFRVLRFFWAFLINALRNSIGIAIKSVKKTIYDQSIACASDIHSFVSFLSMRFLLLGLFLFSALINTPNRSMDRGTFQVNPPRIGTWTYEEYLNFNDKVNLYYSVVGIVFAIAALYVASRIFFVANNVIAIRAQLRRGEIEAAEVG